MKINIILNELMSNNSEHLYNVFESKWYYYFIWMQYSGIKTLN